MHLTTISSKVNPWSFRRERILLPKKCILLFILNELFCTELFTNSELNLLRELGPLGSVDLLLGTVERRDLVVLLVTTVRARLLRVAVSSSLAGFSVIITIIEWRFAPPWGLS